MADDISSLEDDAAHDEYSKKPRRSAQENKGGACPTVNVSPSSHVEGPDAANGGGTAADRESLNSSRMTGPQELSIHEGMQVMHELENKQQQKHNVEKYNGKGAKKRRTKTGRDSPLNLAALQKEQEREAAGTELEAEKVEVDDQVAQYTVE